MTTPDPPEDDVQPWFVMAALIAVIVLFLVRNVPWHLDDYDQAKQAFTSFEMVEEGHWWYQHTPTGGIATKPPLAGWISTALYLMMGGNGWEFAFRIPPLACAIALAVMLRRSGDVLFGNNIGGLLALAAFALNVFTPRLATLVRTDMMLTLCIFAAGYLVLEKVRTGAPWKRREKWILFWCILASMMIKGPVVYAFLLPGLAAYYFLAKRFSIANNAWSGIVPWVAPLLFFSAWAGIGIWVSGGLEGDFYQQVVQKEFMGRFTAGETAVHQPRNPFFYIGLILLRWLPWSVLLIAFVSVKRIRAAFRTDPALLWLACWALGGLVVMSLVPSKRFDRILPVIPPLCLLLPAMARYLPNYEWRRQPLGRIAILSTFVALSISAGYAGWRIARGYQTRQSGLVDFGAMVRQETLGRGDRLVVINGKDEGMLLYLQHPRFTSIEDALPSWRFHRIDWMVVPEQTLKKHESELAPFERLGATGTIPEKNSAYLFIRRTENLTQPDSAPSTKNEVDAEADVQ